MNSFRQYVILSLLNIFSLSAKEAISEGKIIIQIHIGQTIEVNNVYMSLDFDGYSYVNPHINEDVFSFIISFVQFNFTPQMVT
jgi:hypothetical protein